MQNGKPEAMFWNLDMSDVRRRDWTSEEKVNAAVAQGALVDNRVASPMLKLGSEKTCNT